MSAFAQVTLTGNVDAGYRARTSETATDKVARIQVNNSSTTAFFFQGTEDLGGGMKAAFFAELDWNPTQSQQTGGDAGAQYYVGTPFNGEQFIGLEGSWGKVRIGSPNSAILEANGQAQPFGTAVSGGYMNTGVNRLGSAANTTYGINQYVGGVEAAGRVIRYERSVRYDLPLTNGFTGSYLFASQNGNQTTTSTKANGNNNGVNEYSLKYSNGPLNVIYAKTKVAAGANAQTSGVSIVSTATASSVSGTTAAAQAIASSFGTATAGLGANQSVSYSFLAGNYAWKDFTFYAGYTTGKTDDGLTAIDATSINYAVKYQVNGALSVAANTLKVKDQTSSAKDASLLGLGLDYGLSKRTTAYYRYESADTDKSTATGAGAGAYKTQAVGLRHTF